MKQICTLFFPILLTAFASTQTAQDTTYYTTPRAHRRHDQAESGSGSRSAAERRHSDLPGSRALGLLIRGVIPTIPDAGEPHSPLFPSTLLSASLTAAETVRDTTYYKRSPGKAISSSTSGKRRRRTGKWLEFPVPRTVYDSIPQ